jgi:hypothetical protein
VKNKRERSKSVWPPGVERQVVLVWGTRWLLKSSAGRMVASKMKSCTVPWLSLKAKIEPGRPWRPSHEWDWRGGRTKSVGVAVVHHKTSGFLGWATKPRLKTEVDVADCIGPVWLVGSTDLINGNRGFWRLRSGWHATWSQGLRSGYTGLRWCASVRWWFDKNSQSTLRECVSYYDVIGECVEARDLQFILF